jgi:3',5'-nucleoside bisphosphate phosphatase
MIDLHLHTTASDGRSTPAELLARACEAGLTIVAVTDHDTMAAVPDAIEAAPRLGMTLVPGIELSTEAGEADVHLLGYFLDPGDPELRRYLSERRVSRIERVRVMVDRLARLGCPIDIERILGEAESRLDLSIGRPLVARALVEAGHARDILDAFDRFLAVGRPAHVPHNAATPADAIRMINAAGGLASIAHPGALGRDGLIGELTAVGLSAIEAYYTDHSAEVTAHYLDLARRLGLCVTGGSDYHADPHHGAPAPGAATLPAEEFERLEQRLAARANR